jgi:ABC-type cobalt transport system substrate-binding protein
MKRLRTLLMLAVVAAAPLGFRSFARAAETDWQGVDDKFEEIAKKAGHPAREPYINFIQGDVGLCAFLVAGAVGGFVAGYMFRNLFPPKAKGTVPFSSDHASHGAENRDSPQPAQG